MTPSDGAVHSPDKRPATVTKGDMQFVVDGRRNVALGASKRWTPKCRMLRASGLMYAPLEALTSSLGAKIITQDGNHVLVIEIDGRRGALTAP